MSVLENLEYNKEVLLCDDYFFEGYNQKIYLSKTLNKNDNRTHYFLKLYKLNFDGNLECQGYMYFYLNFVEKRSRFIGVYVKPEYRKNGLASLLVSSWIKLCLDNDIYNLETIRRQRKPLLLYLLKCYSFELKQIQKYDESRFTINICSSKVDNSKALFFRCENQRDAFRKSCIGQDGGYVVLDFLCDDYSIVDRVLLSNTYYIQDDNKAYNRASKCLIRRCKVREFSEEDDESGEL